MRAEQETISAGDRPKRRRPRLRGRIKSVSRLAISGWAADLDEPDRAVQIRVTVNDRQPIRIKASPAGHSPAMGGRKGARKHGFVLPFTPPLPTACDLTIIASFDETGLTLKGGEARLPAVTPEAIEARLFPTKTPPLKSMFLVCTARSGSSLLMGRLAAHPNVVAAKHPIHEIRMTYYYARVLQVLTSPGNHEHSMRPADLTEPGYVVGSNPFYHPSFKDAFATADARDFFFQCVTFGRLKSAFSDVIAEYYRFIAADTGKRSAIFFVEKVNHLMMHRRVALDLFPEATQILLVRDMRDVLCSHRNHFQFRDKSIEFMAGQAEQLIEIARNGRTNTIVVRYEDLVLKEQQTLERLFGSIGIDYVPVANPDSESSLFVKHATSKSPATSIGRWKRELTDAEQQQANEAFKEYLETFEYA